jgi:signal peptidase I
MAAVLVAGTLLLVTVAGVFLSALFLWLGCRAGRTQRVTYGRALLAALLLALVGAAVTGVALGFPALPFPALLVLGLLVLFVQLAAVKTLGQASLGRTLLAWLVWQGLGVLSTVLLVIGIRFLGVETFIVPTGAMADTVLGEHRTLVCPQCGFRFAVNAAAEVGEEEWRSRVVGGTCPNCRYHCGLERGDLASPRENGDRILATTGVLSALAPPRRFDLFVFTYPGDEEVAAAGRSQPTMAYVKRLIGLPGETIGIHYGKLYVRTEAEQPPEDRQAAAQDLHWRRYMHEDAARDVLERPDRGEPGKAHFQILRKPPDVVLALRRLVYDNDPPAKDLDKLPPRWPGGKDNRWTADAARGFRHDAAGDADMDWLRYRHVLRPAPGEPDTPHPRLITDFLGYNTFETSGPLGGGHRPPPENWVGDLLLECELTVERPAGEFVLELARGVDRFRARWDLTTGVCTLAREQDKQETELDRRPTAVKQPGTYRLRLANVDDRLTVWVADDLPFGDGVAYEEPAERGPTAANDLQPAGIGARGAAVAVHHLTLWRDTYFPLSPGGNASDAGLSADDWADPARWEPLRKAPGKTFFVQPGHYFCLGDNSAESSDSRMWGTVPGRLLHGVVVYRYYPFSRAGLLR